MNREDLERQIRRAAWPSLSQYLSEPVVRQPHEMERYGDAGGEEQNPDDGKVGGPAQPPSSRLLVEELTIRSSPDHTPQWQTWSRQGLTTVASCKCVTDGRQIRRAKTAWLARVSGSVANCFLRG